MSDRKFWPVLSFAIALALVSGCKPKPPETTPTPPQPAETAPAETAPKAVETPPPKEITSDFPTEKVETGEIPAAELNRKGVLKTVYFAFDSYELDDQARQVLQANAQWLKSNPGRSILIEGHCDERGTIEYNLALGERRAGVVRDYLVGLGIDAFRIRIVSYGEEDPVDPGHTEEAWAKNRRAESVIVEG
jgi:peptidoglycan-associated lipoprotein